MSNFTWSVGDTIVQKKDRTRWGIVHYATANNWEGGMRISLQRLFREGEYRMIYMDSYSNVKYEDDKMTVSIIDLYEEFIKDDDMTKELYG